MFKYFILFAILCFACNAPQPSATVSTEESYFDMPKLVDNQLKLLQNNGAGVRKELEVNKKMEKVERDSVDWEEELSLFAQANINKPVLKGTYQVEQEDKDGVNKVAYHSLDEKNKVKTLEVFQKGEEISKVAILWVDANPIYHSEKSLIMDFENERLTQYSIHGYQKMLADDTLHYNLNAKIMYK